MKTLTESGRPLIPMDGNTLTTEQLTLAARNPNAQLVVDGHVTARIKESRDLLTRFVEGGRVIYGVNTSMGGFANLLIPTKYARELQENLITAVATNVGNYLEDDIVRASMVARLNSLARGTSAISPETFQKYLVIFNHGIIPCIPEKGSLGTSGDLGPLACIALVGIGQWKAKFQGAVLPGHEALKAAGIAPMELGFKEGLALVNGTSAMAGMAALLVEDAQRLLKTYEVISALSFEALKAKKKPFDPVVHQQKPHRGQLVVAANLFTLLKDSLMVEDEHRIERQLAGSMKDHVISGNEQIEDAYSIRCTPQILGPVKDTLRFVKTIVETELNSSNDNPLVLVEHDDVFHNGHFHGQYIAMAMDYMSIGLTTLANLSDRRIDRFLDKNHSNGLPAFLCATNPGRRLGLMGGQFMSTSLTAENRSLCVPLSIQTLPSTEDFQDIVSLGLIAARRAKEILNNTYYIAAFELLCACQAADIRGPETLSTPTRRVHELVREFVPHNSQDTILTDYVEALARLIRDGRVLMAAEAGREALKS